MSIAAEIKDAFPHGEVALVKVNKNEVFHGELATTVFAYLDNGKTVEGRFTTQPKNAFGGVEFSQTKDITGLMVAKIKSVLRGTADA